MNEQPLIWNAGWVPDEPVPCSSDPDAWADGEVYGRNVLVLQHSVWICKRKCSVKDECLERALEEEGLAGARHRYGIRGGLTPAQRHELYKQRNPPRLKRKPTLVAHRTNRVIKM